MISDSAKVWWVIGLMSFMMLFLLLATYNPENVITGASIGSNVASSGIYWGVFLFVFVLGVVVLLKSE